MPNENSLRTKIVSKQVWKNQEIDFDPDSSPKAFEHYKKYYSIVELATTKLVKPRLIYSIVQGHTNFQLAGDSADSYKANCFSDLDFGDKSMYKVLKDCKNDKESLQAVGEAFQLMYPETKTVVGWRGNEFEIDWKYVLNEMWSMAHMLRKPEGDYIVGTDVMRSLNVL